MDYWQLAPGRPLRGCIDVPGDKSIAHRALILGAVATADSVISRLPDGADVRATIAALRLLGVTIDCQGDACSVQGVGLHGLRQPDGVIDCGNSGTTMRLLAGLLAGAGVRATLTGDRSLRRRPMARIAEPLRAMGAVVRLQDDDHAPVHLQGGTVRAVAYRSPVASAQVKGCVLLAGLFADGVTRVIEETPTRDHTERLLGFLGAEVDGGPGVGVRGGPHLGCATGRLPGDASSAAFWLAAASVTPGSELLLRDVGVNPTRRAFIDLLLGWGADIEEEPRAASLGEPQAHLRVRAVPQLAGGFVDGALTVALIDELPLLGLLGATTRDGLEVRGAAELRHKESDRIASSCSALRALGARVQEYPDGFAVAGGQPLAGGTVDSQQDHRIVMAAAAVSGACSGPVRILGARAAEVSYAAFREHWQQVTA